MTSSTSPLTAQSVYGLVEEGTQCQSPIHTPSHHCRKGTKEDVEKEVKNLKRRRRICIKKKDRFTSREKTYICTVLYSVYSYRGTVEKIDFLPNKFFFLLTEAPRGKKNVWSELFSFPCIWLKASGKGVLPSMFLSVKQLHMLFQSSIFSKFVSCKKKKERCDGK